MFEEEDRETGYAVFIAVTLAIVVSFFAIAVAIGNAIGQAAPKAAAAGTASPSIVRILAVVYFEVGKADVPDDARMLLRPAIRAAQAAPASTLILSGYHDASGDAAANAELAKRRALAVREALIAAGVSEKKIALARPLLTLGGADAAEARRVEVTLR